MGKRTPSPPRQPRPSKTGWDWRRPPPPAKPGPPPGKHFKAQLGIDAAPST